MVDKSKDYKDMVNVEKVIFKEEFYSDAGDFGDGKYTFNQKKIRPAYNSYGRKGGQSASMNASKRSTLGLKKKLMSQTGFATKFN
jgi:hypothetical protein